MKLKTIKKNYEFKNILTKGKRFCGNYINIYIKENNKNINKIGIAINTKMFNSVNRNRIKRLIRENYRLLEENIETGKYFVFVWKKDREISEATFLNIKNDMYAIFKRANLIKE